MAKGLYSAINNVVDILADRRSRRSRGQCFSIGFGVFKEVGMGAVDVTEKLEEKKNRSSGHENLPVIPVNHPFVNSRISPGASHVIYLGDFMDDGSWVYDHRFKGQALISAATIIECVRAAFVHLIAEPVAVEFSQVAFQRPLFVDSQGTRMEISFVNEENDFRFEVRTRSKGSDDDWMINVIGFASKMFDSKPEIISSLPTDFVEDSTWSRRTGEFTRGERWDCVDGINIDGDATWGKLNLHGNHTQDFLEYQLHPAMFDRALHTPCWRFFDQDHAPYAIRSIKVYAPLIPQFNVYGIRQQDSRFQVYDVNLFDHDGSCLVQVEGYVLRPIADSGDAGSYQSPDTPLTSHTVLNNQQKLVVNKMGSLESLCAVESEQRMPGPGEVLIDVIAAGLSYGDVLLAQGRYPGSGAQNVPFGRECAGVVRQVGDEFSNLQPGDPVACITHDLHSCLSTSVIAKSELVVPVPLSVTMEDAAGIPVAYLTAEFALHYLGKLKKNERILIHCASGGVGLAAVQLAVSVGAKIYATAGTIAKREFLLSQGVDYVADSRSLDFVEDVRNWTSGEGVDLIVNCLVGDAVNAGLELLRHGGRFIELNKSGVFEGNNISLYPFRKNINYHLVDIDHLIDNGDPLVSHILESVMMRFSHRELLPSFTTVYPVSEATNALQRLSNAAHTGKLVLKIQKDPDHWRDIHRHFIQRYDAGFSIEEGMDILRRSYSCNATPFYVLAPAMHIEFAQVGRKSNVSGQNLRPDLDSVYREARNDVEDRLVGIWEYNLGVIPVGIDDNFFDLGGDSISAIQVQYSVSKRLDVKLSMTALFDYPTIAELAASLSDELA